MVFIVAGPEFGPEFQGRILLIVKSLYGLKSSAARWHEELAQTIRDMGLEPSKILRYVEKGLWYLL